MTDTETRTNIPPTYADYAADLRRLADLLDSAGYNRLPLPHYPYQGLDIDIHTASHLDVDQAAKILDAETCCQHGHTTAAVDVGTVHLRFVYVDAASMAQHAAKTSYGPNLVAS